MRLYILRHAEAEERGRDQPDERRELTARGRRQAREVAAAFGEGASPLDIRPTRIIASPAARAAQTAAPIAAILGLDVEFDDHLGLDADARDAEDLLRTLDASDSVVIVGHNPTLAELSARCGGEPAMKKAEVAVFDYRSEQGRSAAAGRFRPHA